LIRDYEALDQDEKTINVHISHLREKIEDDPSSPKFVLTVRARGTPSLSAEAATMSPERPIEPSAEKPMNEPSVNGTAIDDDGDGGGAPRKRRSIRISLPLPRTFQGRLSLAFVIVFAVAVGVVSALTIFVLDRDLRQQDQATLEARAQAVAAVLGVQAEDIASQDAQDQTVVSAGAS